MISYLAYSERLAELALQVKIWWLLAGLSLLLITIFAIRIGGYFAGKESRRPRFATPGQLFKALHDSDSALASMEFLMVLFPFLLIVMTVWQMAFMINAKLQIGYSAYAAARSAAVWIPAELDEEPEGLVKKAGDGKAEKWSRIGNAAIPGAIAMSPGKFSDALAVWGAAKAEGAIRGGGTDLGNAPDPAEHLPRLLLMSLHTGGNFFQGNRAQRAAVKQLYAENMLEVLINNKDESNQLNVSGDTVTVTVKYHFWMNVPWVGRMLDAAFDGLPTYPADKNPFTYRTLGLNPYPTHVIGETITMEIWPRKRAITPQCP